MTSKTANREALDSLLEKPEILVRGMGAKEGSRFEYYSIIVKPGGQTPKLYTVFNCGLIFGRKKYDIKVMDILGMKWSETNQFMIVDILGERLQRGVKRSGRNS